MRSTAVSTCASWRARRGCLWRVAVLYATLGAELGIDWLRQRVDDLPQGDTWQNAARAGLRNIVRHIQRRVTAQALKAPGKPAQRSARWLATHDDASREWREMLGGLRSVTTPDFAALSVGMESLRRLVNR
jgi:NAD-specific glutamate dehydrogenase